MRKQHNIMLGITGGLTAGGILAGIFEAVATAFGSDWAEDFLSKSFDLNIAASGNRQGGHEESGGRGRVFPQQVPQQHGNHESFLVHGGKCRYVGYAGLHANTNSSNGFGSRCGWTKKEALA